MGLVLGVMGRTASGPTIELKAGHSSWIQMAFLRVLLIQAALIVLHEAFAPHVVPPPVRRST
jgi:hypothetical protein